MNLYYKIIPLIISFVMGVPMTGWTQSNTNNPYCPHPPPCWEPNDDPSTWYGNDCCRPKPEGSAVEGQPCLECDGQGNPRDKPNKCIGCKPWWHNPPIYDCITPCQKEFEMRTLGHCQNNCEGCIEEEYVVLRTREATCSTYNDNPSRFDQLLEDYIRVFCLNAWDIPNYDPYIGGCGEIIWGLVDLIDTLGEVPKCICTSFNIVCGTGLDPNPCVPLAGADWEDIDFETGCDN